MSGRDGDEPEIEWFDEAHVFTPAQVREILAAAGPTLADSVIMATIGCDLRPEPWQMDFLRYMYDPEPPRPFIREGVTEGWVVSHGGELGPAKALKVQALADGDGFVSLVPDGEWEDVTIVDNRGDQG